MHGRRLNKARIEGYQIYSIGANFSQIRHSGFNLLPDPLDDFIAEPPQPELHAKLDSASKNRKRSVERRRQSVAASFRSLLNWYWQQALGRKPPLFFLNESPYANP